MKNHLHRLAAASLLGALFASSVCADTFGLHAVSVHSRPGFNGINPGFYYRAENGLTAGTYRNSENAHSMYAGYTHNLGAFDASIILVNGYRAAHILPTIVPSYAVQLGGGFALRTSLLLNPLPGGANAVHFSVEAKR